MPVGTTGSVKAVHFTELEHEIGATIILSNAYHLYLRPGIDTLVKAGGLHQFSGWNKPLLTDSGGYQVYSLADKRKIKEEGVAFQSHIDGSRHLFTPEKVIDIQRAIGADIIMALDECPPYPCEYCNVAEATERTHRWLQRCVNQFNATAPLYDHDQALFPIIQGGLFADLRKHSAETIAAYDLNGYAIGGLSVGEPAEEMYAMTEIVCQILPANKPRYLMGVGTPENILEAIALGIDMFDCVLPTRNGRNGMLFTTQGIINIRNKKWQHDFTPLDPQSPCAISRSHSKAYLRHLFVAEEILALQIASINNLALYMWLVKQARQHILAGDFATWKKSISRQLMQKL